MASAGAPAPPTALQTFRSTVALQRISTPDRKDWRFYDWGPRDKVPLVCVHGTSGTELVFYNQMLSLGSKGYRVISVRYPDAVPTHEKWARAFEVFLQAMDLPQIHLFGVSLGGFLAQIYATLFPARVLSLALSNAFVDTTIFHNNAPCISMFPYMPEFYLKKYILDNFPTRTMEAEMADAVDFMVDELETLSQSELASRLTLNCLRLKTQLAVRVPEEAISLIDSADDVVLPSRLAQQLYELYPGSRKALIKSGGDFPFLSRADEVTMHLQVHLRVQESRLSSESADDAGAGAGAGAGADDDAGEDGGEEMKEGPPGRAALPSAGPGRGAAPPAAPSRS